MSPKGDKLWFRAFGNQLMEVDVTSGATVSVSEPRAVFRGDPISVDLTLGYAVVGNGERFIAARRVRIQTGRRRALQSYRIGSQNSLNGKVHDCYQRRQGQLGTPDSEEQNPAEGVEMRAMRTTIRALFVAVTSCALLSVPAVGQAQSPPSSPLFHAETGQRQRVAAIDDPAAKGVAGANGGFVISNDGIAVIDGFASANAARELLAEMRKQTKLR